MSKNKYKCKICGKTENRDTLPYQWASIHQESSGCHDSACVTWDDDYFLCPDHRIDNPTNDLVEALEAVLDAGDEGCCEECIVKDNIATAALAAHKNK